MSTFKCPLCNAVSHHPDDAANRYCGRCHRFVDDAWLPDAFTARVGTQPTTGELVAAALSIDDASTAEAFLLGWTMLILARDLSNGANRDNPDAAVAAASHKARLNIGFCMGESMTPARRAMWHKVTGGMTNTAAWRESLSKCGLTAEQVLAPLGKTPQDMEAREAKVLAEGYAAQPPEEP